MASSTSQARRPPQHQCVRNSRQSGLKFQSWVYTQAWHRLHILLMHSTTLKLLKNAAMKKRVYFINPHVSQMYISKGYFFSELQLTSPQSNISLNRVLKTSFWTFSTLQNLYLQNIFGIVHCLTAHSKEWAVQCYSFIYKSLWQNNCYSPSVCSSLTNLIEKLITLRKWIFMITGAQSYTF